MHIAGSCFTWLGRKRFCVILLHRKFFGDISMHNALPVMVAFDGKCLELSFGMHIARRAGLLHLARRERALSDPAPLWAHPPILQMTITQQPIAAACSSRYRWAALPAEQPELEHRGLAPQSLGVFCENS